MCPDLLILKKTMRSKWVEGKNQKKRERENERGKPWMTFTERSGVKD